MESESLSRTDTISQVLEKVVSILCPKGSLLNEANVISALCKGFGATPVNSDFDGILVGWKFEDDSIFGLNGWTFKNTKSLKEYADFYRGAVPREEDD